MNNTLRRTQEVTIMKQRTHLLFVILLLSAIPGHAGLLFDDPIELQAIHDPHLLSKDEIHFIPTGKCKEFNITYVDVTLELTYSTGTRVLNATQTIWNKPCSLTFSLPDNLNGLQSYHLKGKYRDMFVWKKEWWAVRESIASQVDSTDDATRKKAYKEMVRYMDFVRGYKIDSNWTVNSR
jgi:hypothetical protein